MTFWLKNLHRTLCFYVTTLITAILHLPFCQEQHLIKNEPRKTQTTVVTMYSPLCVCESRLNETEKRQFHMYEHKELVKLDAPWYSPSGH